ncbi:MAG: hypothetical protein HOV66_27945 [Streptomycetaceae bacterium]|nr:hypothetical protein [Streptomycetaceae bacterium]
MLGTGRIFEPTDRTAALDRVVAQAIRKGADLVAEAISDGEHDPDALVDELRGLANEMEAHARKAEGKPGQPLVVRRVDVVIEPDRESGETETIVGCIAEDGRPVALVLDDVDRRKLARKLRLGDELPGRQALLLHHIRRVGGMWGNRRANELYRRLGLERIGPNTGRKDLAALARAGHLSSRGPQDGRYYSLPSRKERT